MKVLEFKSAEISSSDALHLPTSKGHHKNKPHSQLMERKKATQMWVENEEGAHLTGATVLMKSKNLLAWVLEEKKKSSPSGFSFMLVVCLCALCFKMTCSKK